MVKAALCGVAAFFPLVAQSVSEKDGNIFFRDAAGSVRQITSAHLDSDPSPSFDNKQIVFVRRTPGHGVDTGRGDTDFNELWIASSDNSNPARCILRGRPGSFETLDHLTLADFGKPQFSPDGNRIYFTASIWATSSAINILDLRTGATRFLYAGLDVEVIRDGKYKGYLIGTKDPLTDRGRIEVYWLLDPDGKEVSRIGEHDSDLEAFKGSLQRAK